MEQESEQVCGESINEEEPPPLKNSFFIKTIDELEKYVPIKNKKELEKIVKKYRMQISSHYLSLIRDFENDPILKQCVPSKDELIENKEDNIDPLAEESMSPVPCLVHRYPDRALLLVTGRCFMYCRHCTRKRLWQEEKIRQTPMCEIEKAVQYISEHKEIREIVISGGDPLTLTNDNIDTILSLISSIKNVEVIRIGTRAPVVYPERINNQLCKILKKYHKLWINVQFNHPREVVRESIKACRKIQRCGIPINNQSVLLKGINDDPETMRELCQRLQSARIRPYYLFICDKVLGTSHFQTDIETGIRILDYLRGKIGGLAIPTFVVDLPEGGGKIPLLPNYINNIEGNKITFRNLFRSTTEYSN